MLEENLKDIGLAAGLLAATRRGSIKEVSFFGIIAFNRAKDMQPLNQ